LRPVEQETRFGRDALGRRRGPHEATLSARLRRKVRALQLDARALALAARDPRTPRAARALAIAVTAYALSPIDLVPDFIPVLGWLDDLLIVPAGIALCLRMIPAEVLREARERVGRQESAAKAVR
jgi:uncharacterized membrane protein YkvA (DUF1232 family)